MEARSVHSNIVVVANAVVPSVPMISVLVPAVRTADWSEPEAGVGSVSRDVVSE